jgi:hypothetical protein
MRARKDPSCAETFGGWLDRHGQTEECRQAFWDPFFVPALNAGLDEVSAEAALFVLRTAFLEKPGAARFGFARVPLARIAGEAARRLDHVRLRTPAVGLAVERRADGRMRLEGILLDDGTCLRSDGAVIALPPSRLKRVLGRAEEFGVLGLDDFRTAPIVDVHLWYDVPALNFGFAALLGSPVQWVFEKGPGYLCCSMSAADEYISRSGQDLVQLCHLELASVLPQLRDAKPLRGAATRDREATFIPLPGLRRPGARTACPQVVIAGSWTDTGWPATMESAVRSGRIAARILEEGLVVQDRRPPVSGPLYVKGPIRARQPSTDD